MKIVKKKYTTISFIKYVASKPPSLVLKEVKLKRSLFDINNLFLAHTNKEL